MATRKQWDTARINPAGSQPLKGLDKRVKLTDDDRAEIRRLSQAPHSYSQRELARAFGVSRRLVTFVLFPERLAPARALFKERRKDGRYYDKEKHTQAQRNHRAHLREVNPALNEGDKRSDTIRKINTQRAKSRTGKIHTTGGEKSSVTNVKKIIPAN